jgi:hypothetical protein
MPLWYSTNRPRVASYNSIAHRHCSEGKGSPIERDIIHPPLLFIDSSNTPSLLSLIFNLMLLSDEPESSDNTDKRNRFPAAFRPSIKAAGLNQQPSTPIHCRIFHLYISILQMSLLYFGTN